MTTRSLVRASVLRRSARPASVPSAPARAFSVAVSRAQQAEAGAGADGSDVVYEVQQAEFQEKVMGSSVPVVLDCYAE